jgi:adenosylcobinamide-phosphate synthase
MHTIPAQTLLAQTAAALLIEAAFGYPDALFCLVRHPVMWVGALIAALDRGLPRSRGAGVFALAIVLLAAGAPCAALQVALPGGIGLLILAVLGSTLLASRSLASHVAAVGAGLRLGLPQGRSAVAHIVGRDLLSLDEAGVARAAIESLAENFADGVVAPAVWGCVAGLPGMAVYKAANTADSMIGHRTPRHERFGWAAARFDDVVNLPASRLAALWLVCAAAVVPGADARAALRAVWRDAGRHRSPNAGWPEAAMAGALGLRLAGPRQYGGAVVHDAWMGDGRAAATADDVDRALLLFRVACAVQVAAVIVLAALV